MALLIARGPLHRRVPSAYQDIEIRAGEARGLPDMTLSLWGWLKCRVVHEKTGKPLAGQHLLIARVQPGRPDEPLSRWSYRTDEQGAIMPLPLLPGTPHRVSLPLSDQRKSQTSAITLAKGEVKEIVFRLDPGKPAKPGTIRAQVINASTGVPIPNAAVTFYSAGWRQTMEPRTLNTDASGVVSLTVTPELYGVGALGRDSAGRLARWILSGDQVRVEPGKEYRITLRVDAQKVHIGAWTGGSTFSGPPRPAVRMDPAAAEAELHSMPPAAFAEPDPSSRRER
jgi:hypothetical protein